MKNGEGEGYVAEIDLPACGVLGLSKREYFSGLAMQGRLASFVPEDGPISVKDLASFAIHCADDLIEKLKDHK